MHDGDRFILNGQLEVDRASQGTFTKKERWWSKYNVTKLFDALQSHLYRFSKKILM